MGAPLKALSLAAFSFRSRSSLSSAACVGLTALACSLTAGCIEELPDKIALAPGAETVEVISDPPNKDVYDAVGGVHTSVIATETTEAVRNAKNELRNQAARKGATFVSIDEVSSRASWDLRGRTVVTMSGTAFKPK